MTGRFYANGKLILSGEYLVLNGAGSIVLPLKLGQSMDVNYSRDCKYPCIHWEASVCDKPWFKTDIKIGEWTYCNTNDDAIASRLVNLLLHVQIMNPGFFKSNLTFNVSTNTNFDLNWGLGSSSALIANIAHWTMTDPFELYFRNYKGSGADIAGAISNSPVLYRVMNNCPVINQIQFKPDFFRNLWFVYTGRKQNTSETLKTYFKNPNVDRRNIEQIDRLTLEMAKSRQIESFMDLVKQHEIVISKILGKPSVKDNLFSDFDGQIKSLGSWGGDFILAVSNHNEETIKNYFAEKGLKIIFSFDELVL